MKTEQNKYQDFLNTHQVFHSDEMERDCSVSGYHARNLLSKLIRERKIRKLRRSLYSVLPDGAASDFVPPSLLIAAKQTADAVLGYRSALAFHGMSRNVQSSHTFLSRHRLKSSVLNNELYQPCLPAHQLKGNEDFGVESHTAWDTPVRVVSKERLLVDLFDRLELSGGWEEIVNAYQYEDKLNFKQVLAYLKLLNHPATSARVGFFLEQFQSTMNVPDMVLHAIEKLKPKNAEHFYRSHRKGNYVKRWNLYVPEELKQSSMEYDYEF